MRGDDSQQAAMFSYLSPEERVPPDHPLRSIRAMVDAVTGVVNSEGISGAVVIASVNRCGSVQFYSADLPSADWPFQRVEKTS